jgi:lipopolysaccharide transport system permease protein
MAELIIEAGRTEGQYWRDLWRYRELFYVLAWRDIMVRYKQTAIGVAWAVIQPLSTTIIMTVVFQYFAHVRAAGNSPYALMVFAGTLPWQFFTTALGNSSNSTISSAQLISKIYFPRLIVPASAVMTALADFGVQFLLLALMLAYYHFWPTWRLLFLPAFIFVAFLFSMGPGLFFTALSVKYRDFRHIVPFLIQVGAYATPVFYPTSIVIAKLQQYSPHHWIGFYSLYCLNPMVGIINGFRWCILGGQSPFDVTGLILSINMTIFLLLLGIWYFRRTERSFADML